jgi:hypothetical protein
MPVPVSATAWTDICARIEVRKTFPPVMQSL